MSGQRSVRTEARPDTEDHEGASKAEILAEEGESIVDGGDSAPGDGDEASVAAEAEAPREQQDPGGAPAGEDLQDDALEESAPLRVARDPGLPTQSERDDHCTTHWPYRSWCEDCVRGRGLGEQHRSGGPSRDLPVLSFDYLFITGGKMVRRDELDDAEADNTTLKILVLKCSKTKAVFAHVVDRKGTDAEGYAVRRMVEDIMWLGHTRLTLKADNERAIVKLLGDALRTAKSEVRELEQVQAEHPSAYDSRSNGEIENTIRNFQGLMRTMKLGLERRLSVEIPHTHPLMSWLAEHTAFTMSITTRGDDGKTAFQRVKGTAFGKRLLEFGEYVLFKLPSKGPRHDATGKLAERWSHGYFLGFSRNSNDYVCWTPDGAVKARAQQRLTSDRRWPAGGLEAVDRGAGAAYAPRVPERFRPAEEQPPQQVAEKRGAQSIQVRKADWLKHGSTPGCGKCLHADTFGWGQMGGPHSQDCVERFRRFFMESEVGRERLAREERRQQQRRPEEGGDMMADAPPPPSLEYPPAASGPETPRVHDQQPASPMPDEFAPSEVDQPMGDDQATPQGEDEQMEHVSLIQEMMAVAVEADVIREIQRDWKEIVNVVESLGGCSRRYGREKRQQLKAIVSEIYSPPRVTAAIKLLPEFNLIPGFAFDITTMDENGRPWDFNDPIQRARARERVLREKPMLLIGSPMCTAFSAWQELNKHKRDPETLQKEWNRAMVHLNFVCELYKLQDEHGRYFLHEHPVGASSWKEVCIREVMALDGVARANGDQCQYGQEDRDGNPIKKPTGWMSNSEETLKALSRRCSGRNGECSRAKGGRHTTCNGQTARRAAIYPFRLCKSILQGFRNQLRRDGVVEANVVGMQMECEINLHDYDYAGVTMEEVQEDHPGRYRRARRALERKWRLKFDVDDSEDEESREGLRLPADEAARPKLQRGVQRMEEILAAENHPSATRPVRVFKDTTTGQVLNPKLVMAARLKELEYFESKGVWIRRPRSECIRKTGKRPISVKWVDTNKGDDDNPNYRSRLVAREIRLTGEDPIFAPTPPLESVRMVLSLAATDLPGEPKHDRRGDSERRTQVSIIDISRAYFNAKKDMDKDPTYVELPEEDDGKAAGMCGLLRVHMYGTRAAADGWHGEYSTFMKSLGFVMGDASACVFRHRSRRLTSSVHGDDFTTAGPKEELDWLKSEMEKRYELTENHRIGPGPQDGKEAKILNRIVRWTDLGIEYEADPRQGEKLVTSLGLGGAGIKSVGTPGVKQTREGVEEDKPLERSKHTPFRAVSARGNFLSADRPEIQYATKEICRWMSAPTVAGVAALKRLGRYLVGHQRLVFSYPWQEASSFEIYSDTDWAGCIKTRKSTSGGCLMMGSHLLKSWSSTQGLISLSSGEAEFYGVTKAAGIALGMKALMSDLGVSMPVRVWTDSSATVGICGRQGLGKLRHIDTRSLWIQQKLRAGALELRKVRGEVNPADLFTKHLSSSERVTDLLKLLNCTFRAGRPEAAPQMRKGGVAGSKEEILAVEPAEEQVYPIVGERIERHGHLYPAVEWEGELVPEAYLHDDRVLPHQVQGDLDKLFPRLTACDERTEDLEGGDWLEDRGLEQAHAGADRAAETSGTAEATDTAGLRGAAATGAAAAPSPLRTLICASPARTELQRFALSSEEECREVRVPREALVEARARGAARAQSGVLDLGASSC